MSWWDAIDDYLREREQSGADVPDPWGDVDLGDSALTDEQIAYLAFDQPGVPRVHRLHPGDRSPPDADAAPGARSDRDATTDGV